MSLVEFGNDVFSGFGFELTFENILFTLKGGGEIAFAGVDVFLTFEQLQPHVGGTEVAAYADEVVFSRTVAVHDFTLFSYRRCR